MTDLIELTDTLAAEKKAIAEKLIKEIEFLDFVLDGLKKSIIQSGEIGKPPDAVKVSAVYKAYNSTLKNYGSYLKQLEMILRQGGKIEGENALQQWLNKNSAI